MDIISAIDAATGCQHCGNPLGSSPSPDFCSEPCQAIWRANRVSAEVQEDPAVITWSRPIWRRGDREIVQGELGGTYEYDGQQWNRIATA